MKTVAAAWFTMFGGWMAFVYFAVFGIVWILMECVYDATRRNKGRR